MANTTGTRGRVRSYVLGTCDEYGIEEGSVSIVLRTFMEIVGQRSIHSIDMVKGVLLFAQPKTTDDPQSGVIYVYDKDGRLFWGVHFDDARSFTRDQFEQLVDEYGLVDYAARPALLSPLQSAAKV